MTEARALLALVDPPPQPEEFQAFVAGLRDALGALSPNHELRFRGTPVGVILDRLAASIRSDAKGTSTQWNEDPLRGRGATAYRALAQPAPSAPPGSAEGYACLKAILLGLLLVRSRDRKAVDLETIKHVVRFVRLGSQAVHVAHELARVKVIATLPATFVPSQLRAALAQREGVPQALHPRLDEIGHAVDKLARSFSLLDLADPIPRPSDEPTSIAPPPPTSSKSPVPKVKPVRFYPHPPPVYPVDTTSAGVEEPDATFIYGPAFAPSAQVAEEIAKAAEAIDDRLPLTEGLIQETAPSISTVKRRTTALRLLSDVRQGFWARFQWDALSPGEMRHALQRLRDELALLETKPDATRHEALTLGLLSGSTGLARARCHSIRTISTAEDKQPPDLLGRDLGRLTLPLVARKERYQPKPEHLPSLREVKDALSFYLPQEVTAELRRLVPSDDGYVFRSDLATLEEILDSLFQDARDAEPRITAARLFRGHQLEVLVQCGDPPVAQALTGQTIGTPPVGLSYYTAKSTTLQAIYDRAVASHGLTPSKSVDSEVHLVGSKLALTDKAFASAVKSISQGLVNRPREGRTQGRELLYLQDALVRATAFIWMAGTSFRPTFRLGEIRASHINWISRTAAIVDKLTDAAHEGRLVPLAPTLMQSLGAYGAIIDLIAKAKELNDVVRLAARQALTGEGPLFFTVGKDGKAHAIDPQEVLTRLPEGWNLPDNFLRHRIATRLREEDCPGLYVQALMGHIENGIQPFGPDSFMVPAEYLETARTKIERVLQDDGWRPLLGGFGDPNVFLDYAPPANDAVLRVERVFEEATANEFKRQRQEVETLRKSLGDQIHAQVLEQVGKTRPELINTPDQPYELNSSAVTALRVAVTDGADSAALAELRVRALRDYLKKGREDRGWKVKRLPQFFAFQPTPTVHHPTFVPAHLALERLRAHFVSHLNVDPGKVAPTTASAKLNFVLALILWQGVCSWDRLKRILERLREAEPLSSNGEGIAIPVSLLRLANDPTPEPSSEVLTGAVALAAITAQPYLQPVDRKEIEDLVAAWAPPAYVKAPKGQMLDVLFALARIGHRFESPPPLRLVWSEQILSVAMPLDRLRALFGRPAAPVDAPPPPIASDDTSLERDTSLGAHESAQAYKWLKATLRGAKDATKPFPADTLAPLSAEQANSPNARTKGIDQSRRGHFKEACRRLDDRLKRWPQDGSLARALTAYALDRLEKGTPWSPKIEPSVVYKYVVGAGSVLFNHDPDMHLSDLEEEDFAALYVSCIKQAKKSYQEDLTGFLAYFHGYLVQQNLAPRVSIGRSGDKVVSFPEVGYVAPNEAAASVALLESELAAAEKLASPLTEIRATLAALGLGSAAGTRTSETLLRENRELVTDQGRRALLVRKNRWVSTKTHRSTRLVDLEPTMPMASWTAIENWQALSGSARTDQEIERSALFSETVDGRTPLPSERLARRIAATLRHSTKRQDARYYWWRHTAVSNDVLALFATLEMLTAIRQGTTSEGMHWLPDPLRMRKSLGGDIPLGQAHAAGFRSRRGHADMQTPFSTYAHTTGLIEPWACREASEELSSTALATLSGLRPAALRQRLSRSDVSISKSSRPAICFLLKQGLQERSATPVVETLSPPLPASPKSGAIDPEQFCEALFRSLRRGNLQPLIDSLHLSTAAAERLSHRLRDALETNVFGLNIGIELAVGTSAPAGIPRARAKESASKSFDRVDQQWIRACFRVRCEHPELAPIWSIVLRGLDPRSGAIAVRSDQEFIALLNQLPLATSQSDQSQFRISVVLDRSVSKVEQKSVQEILDGTASKGSPMHEAELRAPMGWMLAGTVVESPRTGRRQIAGLAMLAIASELLSSR